MTLDPRDADLVFLAWREAPAMLERHHAAVAAALPGGWRGSVVLIENAAPPATARAARELVSRHYGGAVRRVALRLPRNYGFGRAMNLALAECPGEVALLQNSDGRPTPGMLDTLVRALDAQPQAIWVAPGIHGPGEPDHPAGPAYPEQELPGMALAIRRRAFLALGGFDPLFFFYNEDFDASRRIQAAGGELVRAPQARFDHGKGGRSSRGRLIREFWFAFTHQTLTLRHEPERAGALLRSRRRALGAHRSDGDWPGLAGIAVAALLLPASALAAAQRRRAPWTGARLERWLTRHRPRAERIEL